MKYKDIKSTGDDVPHCDACGRKFKNNSKVITDREANSGFCSEECQINFWKKEKDYEKRRL